ncbi:MAG TPA: HAMP domain-containing sensor histidine kinase, partial [Puia sp.]|nr:HAMP domain-containing sensor histidine kinase [Puia sp.]
MNVAAIDQDRANAGTPVRSGKPMRILIPDKMVEKKPDQFASALAHEIRNPLTNINLAAEMLQSTLIAKDQKIYLDIIMRASERINDLTADLLSYYQTDEVRVEICSVHQLLDDALATTMDRIRLKHIIIKKQYTLLDAQILVNKQPMKIALANMIINAIEAMPSKNGQLSLVTKSMDGQCIVEIKDNGAGISKEDLR